MASFKDFLIVAAIVSLGICSLGYAAYLDELEAERLLHGPDPFNP